MQHYGTSDDTERLKRYDEEVGKFCERRIFELSLPAKWQWCGQCIRPKPGGIDMHLVAVVNTEKVIAMCTNRQTHIFILTFVSPLLPVCLSYPALTLATSNFQSSNEYLLLVPFLF